MFKRRHHTANPTAGFSLLELLVVVVIVGILSAIAAPSWLAFITSRRLEAVNEDALGLFREAQSQAIKTRSTQSFGVDLRDQGVTGTPPQATPLFLDGAPQTSTWEQLGTEINPDTIAFRVYQNVAVDNAGSVTADAATGAYVWVNFDHLGVIDSVFAGDENTATALNVPIAIATVEQRALDGTDGENTTIRRCFIIQTLLGGVRQAEKGDCPAG